jgi:hypothetical protein
MKRGSLLQFLGIWASSLTSIFAAHALMAKSDIKELTKTSKKLRPSQSQNAPEENAQEGMPPPTQELEDSDFADRYPWKKSIVTTTFWIGEKPAPNNPVPNHKSSWDAKWAQNYGGTDTPDRKQRTGEFIPADFVPRQNPFYVALPQRKTSNIINPKLQIPFGKYKGPHKSVCKGRGLPSEKGSFATPRTPGPSAQTTGNTFLVRSDRFPTRTRGRTDVPAVRDFLGMEDTDDRLEIRDFGMRFPRALAPTATIPCHKSSRRRKSDYGPKDKAESARLGASSFPHG